MKKLLVLLIRLYQLCISPFFQGCCRFFPSCSEYAADSIQKHGVLRGTWRSFKRVCKCGFWHPGGYDPP